MTRHRALEPRAERSAAPGEVQVWHDVDRSWRYRYVHAAGGTKIESNRGFPTRDEAVGAARVAYPGVPVVELSSPPEQEPPGRGRLARIALRTGGIGILALLLRASVKLALRARRSGRKVRKVAGWVGLAAAVADRREKPRDEGPS